MKPLMNPDFLSTCWCLCRLILFTLDLGLLLPTVSTDLHDGCDVMDCAGFPDLMRNPLKCPVLVYFNESALDAASTLPYQLQLLQNNAALFLPHTRRSYNPYVDCGTSRKPYPLNTYLFCL